MATSLIVLINPKFQIQRANDGRKKADLRQIQSALEIYRADKGGYPHDTIDSQPDNTVVDYISGTTRSLVDLASTTIVYLQNVPRPTSTTDYFYDTPAGCTTSPCSSYSLYACIENSNDSEALSSPFPSGMTCPTGITKYYSVTNP